MCNNTRIQRNTLYNNHTYTKNTSDDYNNNHTYAQVLITTTTTHTQHKYLLQFRSDGEKDEFLKHFRKWRVNLCV